MIVGEDDPSDRFTYWIHRINKGGEVLVPDAKKKNVQFIDVKDLADWTVKMVEEKKSGVYNATGPDYELTFENFFEECKKVLGKNPMLIWVDEKFLVEENVMPWSKIPLWVSEEDEGINNVNVSKAIKDGLTFCPLSETLRDTLEFDNNRTDHKLKAGLNSEKEKELLKKWKSEIYNLS